MRKWFIALTVVACAALGASIPATAQQPLPPISQMAVHATDPVVGVQGEPAYARRDGTTLRYFVNEECADAYAANPKQFPDRDRGSLLAFGGADIVYRYPNPNGIFGESLGPLVAGNPAKYQSLYEGAVFAFASAQTKAMFDRAVTDAERTGAPMKFKLAAGGYCLGAMAANNVTPGNPQHTLWVAGIGQWAVFGSKNGPIAWVKKTHDEQRAGYATAVANYHRKIGTPSAPARIAQAR